MEAGRELGLAEQQFKKALEIHPQLPAALDGMRQAQMRMHAQVFTLGNGVSGNHSRGGEGHSDRLATGQRVLISGLVSRPEYNGKSARIVSLKDSSGRYCVALDGPDGKALALKMENLSIYVDKPLADSGGTAPF
jgi:hypothetical protein